MAQVVMTFTQAVLNLDIHQIDIKSAYLNGHFNEEIYMEQLKGLMVQGEEQEVC